ncbi:efflux RND transporter permease subunit [Fodinicurvata sp. EGI_FJ10296]|uniref:efflux RND transporter permease subunit n=1 Tax=Fodinicurvata sp. EGI_FJ10296 TaxID=3231908 RepID=UPI0034519A47
MDIAHTSIDRPVNTWLIVLACLIGGIVGLLTVGRLEDPAFTIKEAIVVTPYPGASASEVEREVTEVLESAVQQMAQLKQVRSKSMPGLSEITVEIQNTYDGEALPQVWDELRRNVRDAQGDLPPGARASMVNDDFGDVFGISYAVTAPGYDDRERADLASFLRRNLLTVGGVSKVDIAGLRDEAIYLDIAQERLASLGIPLSRIINTIQVENDIADAGAMRIGDRSVRLAPTGGFGTVETIESLRIGLPGSTEQISLLDLGEISRQPVEVPDHLIRHNGESAFTLSVAGLTDANIVEVGEAVERRLAGLNDQLPVGVELHPIYEQHVVVDRAINGFVVSLALSVAIVIGVLCLFMGWRSGIVVGAVLLLTVLGTVFMMRVFGIEMERISLGALIIAMGMLVDNAIVVTEGMLVGLQRSNTLRDAASEAVRRTRWPLLGATVIGIMAFSGIGLSDDITGEFLFSLFAVIGISLMLSWVLAIMLAPLFGHYLFRGAGPHGGGDPYGGRLYRGYHRVLSIALAHRAVTVGLLIVITAACFVGFGFVKQSFFPNSNTPMFYVNYWMPQGTDIRAVDRDMAEIESFILDQPEVEALTTTVGRGLPRFMLTYAPEQPNDSYGQFVVRVDERDAIADLADRIRGHIESRYPDSTPRPVRIVFGPPAGAEVEARFSGPDADTLRQLGQQAASIMRASPALNDIRNDWRQRELTAVPHYDDERARIAGVTRTDLAQTLRFVTEGVQAGTYREGDRLIPILARPPDAERAETASIRDRLVWSSGAEAYVPLEQIVTRIETVGEDTLIRRRDRMRTLTVQSNPVGDLTAATARDAVVAEIEAIELPPGYALEWGGEYEATVEAQTAVFQQLPLGFLVMLIISVVLFGQVRQPLIIWLIVPMSVCGVVIALLSTGVAFGFVALLGLLSLSGMLIKNAIVLLDEIDDQIAGGKDPYQGLTDASVSRLRPVMLAAGTTILGMVPLLADAFFIGLAVTIMGGLAFATILTLVAVPVLYALFFRIRPPEHHSAHREAHQT